MRGFRLRASMAREMNVLIREIAWAPADAAACARGSIAATFGESLTITGRIATLRTADTSSARHEGSLEKKIPPCFVLGQETFNSYPATPSWSFKTRIT